MGLGEDRCQGVLQEGFSHHSTQLVLGLSQQLQAQQRRPLYSGRERKQASQCQTSQHPGKGQLSEPLLREGGGREDTVPENSVWNKKLLLKKMGIFAETSGSYFSGYRVLIQQIFVFREKRMLEILSSEHSASDSDVT